MGRFFNSLCSGGIFALLFCAAGHAEDYGSFLRVVDGPPPADDAPRTLNPFDNEDRVYSVNHFMYEPLAIYNEFQDGRIHYRLATDFSYSDDLKHVVVTLRDGLVWSDGAPLTAEDLAFSLDLVLSDSRLDYLALGDQVRTYKVLDKQRVRIDLTEASTLASQTIARLPVVPMHIWEDVEDPYTFANEPGVGSGPFTEFPDGSDWRENHFTQCRNPNYWDLKSLQVDCLDITTITEAGQSLPMFKEGQLDWSGAFIPHIEQSFVALNPEHYKYWFPAGPLVMIGVNNHPGDKARAELLSDISLRRAMSMAMDREAMVNLAAYGYPTMNEYPAGLGRMFHSWNNPEVDRDFGHFGRFDPVSAREILEEAGYLDLDDDGFLETPAGGELKLSFIVPQEWRDFVNVSKIAAQGLTDVGIMVDLQPIKVSTWRKRLMHGDYELAMNTVGVGITPFEHFNQILHSRNQGMSRFSSSFLNDPATDYLLDLFTKMRSLDDQKSVMNALQYRIAEQSPFIPLYNNPLWYQYNTQHFEGFFDADNPFANPTLHDGNPGRLLQVLALKPKSAGSSKTTGQANSSKKNASALLVRE